MDYLDELESLKHWLDEKPPSKDGPDRTSINTTTLITLLNERIALLAVARAAKKFEDADGLFLLRKGIAEALNALPDPLKAEISKSMVKKPRTCPK
jgi:hypothetical protein